MIPIPRLAAALLACALGLSFLSARAETETGAAGIAARADRLAAAAEAMRTAGRLSATRLARDSAQADGTLAFSPALPGIETEAEADFLWSGFFRGAAVFLGRLGSDRPVAGVYSPFADAWLLTGWTETEDGFRLAEAHVRLGGALAGEEPRPEAAPPWLKGEGESAIDDLRLQARARAATFVAVHPAGASEPASLAPERAPALQRRVLYRRLGGLERSLSEVPSAALLADELGAILIPIAEEDWATLDAATEARGLPAISETMRALPPETRGEFVPVTAIADAEAAVVFANDPRQGNVFLLFAFETGEGSKPVLRAAVPFDMYGEK